MTTRQAKAKNKLQYSHSILPDALGQNCAMRRLQADSGIGYTGPGENAAGKASAILIFIVNMLQDCSLCNRTSASFIEQETINRTTSRGFQQLPRPSTAGIGSSWPGRALKHLLALRTSMSQAELSCQPAWCVNHEKETLRRAIFGFIWRFVQLSKPCPFLVGYIAMLATHASSFAQV